MDTHEQRIPLSEAALVAERSESTLRRWLSAGKLTRHTGPVPPHGGSAPVLVDRAELLAHLAMNGQQPRSASGTREGAPVLVTDASPVLPGPGVPAVDALTLARLEVQAGALERERDRLLEDLDRTRRELAEATGRHRQDVAEWKDRHDAQASVARELAEALRTAEVGQARAEADAASARGQAEAAHVARVAAEARAAVPWWRRMLGGPVAGLTGPGEA